VRHRPEFTAVVRGGRRGGARTLVVHLLSPAGAPPDTIVTSMGTATGPGDDGSAPARVGFVVGRTVGPAVVRNRVRRRLRHLMVTRLPALPPGTLVVVRALPAAAGRSFPQLGADLDRALSRCGGRR
jgi:ribonuclease P protein component